METFVNRHAYSYIRFSSLEQAKGDSFRRQVTRTAEFCQKHHLLLNETRYEDLGVSGWTGKNLERGALGDFLLAVKAGKIEKGSVLVVENFDRFSRLKPRVAYNKLAEIIEQGVDVVTLEDGKFHTKDTLDDFATLVSSLAVMQRANEESTRKSVLTGSAWAQKRKLAVEGKRVMTRHCPSWLRLKADGTGFEPIPERVKLVKRIFRLVKEGKGKREIARMLDAEQVPTWSRAKCWRDNYILELVKSRTVLGELHPLRRKQPEAVPVQGYYPAVIDEATWQAAQPRRRSYTAGPQTDVNNVFSGLLFDGYHPDYRMKFFLVNKAKGYTYLQSDFQSVDPAYVGWRKRGSKGRGQLRPLSGEMFRYQKFEEHFLKCFPDIHVREILPARPVDEGQRLTVLEVEKKANDKAVTNLITALESGTESKLVMAQLQKREAVGQRLEVELAKERHRQKAEQYAADSLESELKRLEDLILARTREARLALRALFHRTIERIDVYLAGLLEVPPHLKECVYPDRYGMLCYRVHLVAGGSLWIWWDGTQVSEGAY